MTDKQYKKLSALYSELIESIPLQPYGSKERASMIEEAERISKMLNEEEKGRIESEDKRLKREIEEAHYERELDIKDFSAIENAKQNKIQTRNNLIIGGITAGATLLGTGAAIWFSKEAMKREDDGALREPMTKRLAGSIKWPNFKL